VRKLRPEDSLVRQTLDSWRARLSEDIRATEGDEDLSDYRNALEGVLRLVDQAIRFHAEGSAVGAWASAAKIREWLDFVPFAWPNEAATVQRRKQS
jgi:hypothetical protein